MAKCILGTFPKNDVVCIVGFTYTHSAKVMICQWRYVCDKAELGKIVPVVDTNEAFPPKIIKLEQSNLG